MDNQNQPSKDIGRYKKMKLGQYQLHVLIEATSGLSLDSQSDIDAMISLTAFGKTQYSKAKTNVGFEQTFWGEHFYFSKLFDNTHPIQGQRLMFSVWNHNVVLQDSLIGNYEVDIQRIYSEKNQSINHMWLALSNVQKDFSQITGYIKVSLSVIGQQDDNIELNVQPLSSITKQKKVLMPPNIQRKTYQLIVQLFKGKDIKPQDGNTVDSYIGVEFGQIYTITQPCMKTVSPQYGTRVYVPLALPAVTDSIVIRINDFNFIQKSQVIGSHYINISRILKKEGYQASIIGQSHLSRTDKKLRVTDLQWINFYGPQLQTCNDQQKNVHQFFPQLATYYVGSVLMRISIKEDTDPQRRSQHMQKRQLRIQKKPPHFYSISVKIIAALNLYYRNGRYKILLRVGAEQIGTDIVKCKNGFCSWGTQKVLTIQVQQNQLVPDIFIYLVDENKKKICYLRYKAKQGLIQQNKWVNLKPDLSVVDFQGQQAGYLKLGIQMQKVSRHVQAVSKRISTPLGRIFENDKKTGKIIIQLISAQSIIPLDENGSADPYFVFSYMQTEQISSKKQDTLNPIYFQKIILNAEVVDQQSCPPIVVNAYDQDKVSRDFIGTTFIDIRDGIKDKSVVYGLGTRPKPKWFNITQNGILSGRFLASFILLQNFSECIHPQINIPRAKFRLNLFILGLRGLKSTGILSVKKPYIQFDYENLNLFGADKAFDKSKNVVTQPKQSGSSVNINIFNKTTMILPQNPNYWPSLSGKVKDYVLGGIYQPIIGFFSLNLHQSYKKSQIFIRNSSQNKKIVQNKKKIMIRSQKLQGINQSVLINLRNFIIKTINYRWKINQPNTKLIQKNGNRYQPIDKSFICIFPHYAPQNKEGKSKARIIERYQQRMRQNKQYMRIGYDDKQKRNLPLDKRNKHYRYCLDCTNEEYYQQAFGCRMGICSQTNIRKGRVFASHDTASSVIRKVTTEDTYAGTFKGDIFIVKDQEGGSKKEQQFKNKALQSFKKLSNTMKVYLYLYIIQAMNLPPRDQFSHSDPYLIIRAGQKVMDLQDEHFQDQANPQFFKKIRMLLQLPAQNNVQIQVWDYDPLTKDQLIGSTILDIQNRLFAQNCSLSTNNPIQTHKLKARQSKLHQGVIKFWADLVPVNQVSLYRQFQIGRKAKSNYQVRIIVWGCKDMPTMDVQDMSDLFIVGMFNDEQQQTDVHYRCATGDGYFNWRMVFSVKLPIKNPLVTFRVYDKDLFSGSDFISSGSFSIGKYLQQVFQTDTSTALYLGTQDLSAQSDTVTGRYRMVDDQKMYDRFYIDMRNKKQNQDHEGETVGKIQLSIQILTERDAQKKPVGKGRQQPNQHPHLPQPKGRFQWSLNPLKMMNQLCGAGFKAKIAMAICCLLCFGFIVYFGASFGGSILGGAIGS